MSRLRFHTKPPSQAFHAFFHTEQSHSFLLTRVKADAVILDGHRHALRILADDNSNLGRPRMFGAIVQRLLHETVQAGPMRVGQITGDFAGHHFDRKASPPHDFASLPSQRGNQTEIVQHGRTQQQSHVSHHAHAGLSGPAGRSQPHSQDLAIDGRRRQSVQVQKHCRHGLADLVVQLAREITAFLFLGRDQPVRQLAKLLARLFHFAIACLGLALQVPHPANDNDGQDSAQDQRGR